MVPHLEVIAYSELHHSLSSLTCYLEYGSGSNIILANSIMNQGHIYSVETDIKCLKLVDAKLSTELIKNIVLLQP